MAARGLAVQNWLGITEGERRTTHFLAIAGSMITNFRGLCPLALSRLARMLVWAEPQCTMAPLWTACEGTVSISRRQRLQSVQRSRCFIQIKYCNSMVTTRSLANTRQPSIPAAWSLGQLASPSRVGTFLGVPLARHYRPEFTRLAQPDQMHPHLLLRIPIHPCIIPCQPTLSLALSSTRQRCQCVMAASTRTLSVDISIAS